MSTYMSGPEKPRNCQQYNTIIYHSLIIVLTPGFYHLLPSCIDINSIEIQFYRCHPIVLLVQNLNQYLSENS